MSGPSPDPGRPLAGLRVVDCSSGTAGPRATGLLADYGADVVWVEPPGGDVRRGSLRVPYSVFNRGKKSRVLDLRDPAGQAELRELLRRADIFVHSWRPGVAKRLGLGFDAVHADCPGLICCAVSGFGADGPLRDVPGYEPLVHALVGTMAEQVGFRAGPIYEALPFASTGAAYLAVIGMLSALFRRLRDGRGREVETSLYDGAVAFMMTWGDRDRPPERFDPQVVGVKRSVVRNLQCQDERYVSVHTGAVGAFNRFIGLLGLDDRIEPSADGLDMTVRATADEQRILNEVVPEVFLSKPRAEWEAALLAADVAVMAALEPGEVFDEPQPRHNGVIVTVDDPELGPVEQVGPALRFGDTAASGSAGAPLAGAPAAGQHDGTAVFPLAPSAWHRPVTGDLDRRPLLAGVRVVDLGAYYAGPYSSRLLADLGADVIKVEPLAGDPLRGNDTVFNSAQAGKRALAADLKTPAGRRLVTELISRADVVHHNMRPGAAERLGVGYPDARAVNPRLVYLHAPGWGADGPYAGRQSFAPLLSTYVGAGFEVAGEFNPPLFPVGNEDSANGLLGAVGILIGLVRREVTGAGGFVANPQLHAALASVAHIVRREHSGEVLGAGGLDPLALGVSALDRLYATADGWLVLVAEHERHVSGLDRALGGVIRSDSRFSTPAGRARHHLALGELLADRLARLSTEDAVSALRDNGVPVAVPVPPNNGTFVRAPENIRSGRVAVVPDVECVNIREIGRLLRVSDAETAPHRVAPRLGEHGAQLLAELGYPPSGIARLVADGVVRLPGRIPA